MAVPMKNRLQLNFLRFNFERECRDIVRMHAYLWIVTSWIVVAVICYCWLAVYGNGISGGARGGTITSATKRTGEWFNEVIFWLWRSRRFSPAFGETFTRALNDSFKRIAKTGNYGYEVRFDLPLTLFTKATRASVRSSTRADTRSKAQITDDSADAPYLDHITASPDNTEHLVFRARLHLPKLTLKLNTSDAGSAGKTSTHEILFSDVHGEVEARVAQIADELFVMGCFSGRPEMHVTATPVDADASAAHSARDLEELARRCFVSAVLNFSVGEVLYPESARNSVRLSGEIRNLSLLNDIYALAQEQSGESEQQTIVRQQRNPETEYPSRMLVRVIGVRDFALSPAPQSPFVTVEVDEPTQKYVTEPNSNTTDARNPEWNAEFEININAATKELLFEVYDGDGSISNQDLQKGPRRFLGLSIIGLSELATDATSRKTSESTIHQLPLQARPYTTQADIDNKLHEDSNVIGGTLLIQCQFLHTATYGETRRAARFPTHAEEVSRGTLKNFDQNYIYNIDSDQNNVQKSPSTSDWNTSEPPGSKFSDRSLSRSQSSHLNLAVLVGRPESALSKNTSVSQVNAPTYGRTDSRASSHHSSQIAPLQIQTPSQYVLQLHDGQSSPYNRFDQRSTSSSATRGAENPPNAVAPVFSSASPSIVEPSSPRGSHVQFVNGTTGDGTPKRSSPFRTASETVVGAEGWAPAIHATSMAALIPIRPGIFDFPPLQKKNKDNVGTGSTEEIRNRIGAASPQPPPVPPHHQSRFDAEQEKLNYEQNKTRESSSPQKSRRDESKTRRERSFFDNLRERLTHGSSNIGKRGSKRARSLDPQNPHLEEAAVSTPASRDQSQVRSGISQQPESVSISGSTHSAMRIPRMLNDPKIRSTLILEVSDGEDGKVKYRNKYQKFENDGYGYETNELIGADYGEPEMRYYLIPPEVATQPAAQSLLRAGKKLHVFNNHTFVAVKPRGRVPCSVCSRMITSNFTKQAYQCRDCRKVTHKSCHLRGTSPCQESNLASLPIIDNVNWEDFLHQYQMQEFISVNGV